MGTRDYNAPVPAIGADGRPVFGTFAGGRIVSNPRINPAFGFLQERGNWGSSNYNSLQVSLNRRFTRGFQMQTSYTYSKSLDYGSAGQGAENVGGWVGLVTANSDFNRYIAHLGLQERRQRANFVVEVSLAGCKLSHRF